MGIGFDGEGKGEGDVSKAKTLEMGGGFRVFT